MKPYIYILASLLLLGSCKKDNNELIDANVLATDLSFEDLPLDRLSFRIPETSFTSGIATFNLKKESGDWSGFAISNKNLRTFASSQAGADSTRFSAYTGTYPHAGGNFLVVKPKEENAVVSFSRPLAIEKMLITNTTQVYQTILYGPSYTSAGKTSYTYAPGTRLLSTTQKDFVKVTIAGFDGNKKTGEVDFLLADRNSDDNLKKNYTIADWMPVNLEKLGTVTSIRFYMTSTDQTGGVMNTPPYFCIDGIRFKENIK